MVEQRAIALAERGAGRQARTLPDKLGDYTLLEHIGQGGMADIYLARSPQGRLVAIKEPIKGSPSRVRLRAALVEEARLGKYVRHRHVVRIKRLQRASTGPFIVMELVHGIDLSRLLRIGSKRRIAMPIRLGLFIVSALLEGLDAVHRASDDRKRPLGIVHRDVSPANVLLSFDGCVKLCDFGIAVATTADGVGDTIEGKAGYMSPQQARGHVYDARADVFAVGVLLWELLAGRRMYRARGESTLLDQAARGHVPPIAIRDLSEEPRLHGIVRKALATDPADRYQSALIMRRELLSYCRDNDLLGSPADLGAWLRRHFFSERSLMDRSLMDRSLSEPSFADANDVPYSSVRRIRRSRPDPGEIRKTTEAAAWPWFRYAAAPVMAMAMAYAAGWF